MNIKFIVDSTSDITHEIVEKYNVEVLGIPVMFEDGTTKLDWIEMDAEEFYARLAASDNIPTTSQPSIPVIKETIEKYIDDFDAVIYLTLSSHASGTYQTVNLIKNDILEEHPDANICIFDSMGYSLIITMMLLKGIEAAKTADKLEDVLEAMKKEREYTDVIVTVDTLKYLEKGGRINKASLILGSLLAVKPVLSIVDGIMEVTDKFKGSKQITSKMVKKLSGVDFDADYKEFAICHANCPDKAEELLCELKNTFGEDIKISVQNSIGSTVGTHIGPGTLGLFYRRKTRNPIYE